MLILLDLVMPNVDGYEAIRQIRPGRSEGRTPAGAVDSPEWAGPPEAGPRTVVLALSARVFEEDRQHTREAGFDDFITKPIELTHLLDTIGKHLNLTWQYETSDRSPAEFGAISEHSPVVLPPTDQLENLLKWAKMGDIQAITTQLYHVEQMDPAYRDFVQTVRAIVAEFDTRKLKNYLQACLSNP